MFLVKYFGSGLSWILMDIRISDFSFSWGGKKGNDKTHEALTIGIELPTMERFSVKTIVQKLLALLFLSASINVCVCTHVHLCVCVCDEQYKCYTPISAPWSIFLPLLWTKCPKFNLSPYKLAALSCQERKRPLSIAWKKPICSWEGKVEVLL